MLKFYRGRNQLSVHHIEFITDKYANYFFDVFFTFDYLKSSLNDQNKQKYLQVKDCFFARSLDTFPVDMHVFDKILRALNNKDTFVLYLYLFRLQDKGQIICSAESLSEELSQNEVQTLEQLSLLEESGLVIIHGRNLLNISLNRNWILDKTV